MLSSGFTDTPISRSLVYGLIGISILVSITDIKHYFYIQVDLHLWQYHQGWRVLLYQLCYLNSTEVLFAAMIIYNMRVIERLWGSHKYASFLLIVFVLTTFIPLLLLVLVIRPLSFNTFNYLPTGPTSLIFAILAQYYTTIPPVYKYRITTSPRDQTPSEPFIGITLSDKSYIYLPALQLSLSQFPGSFLCAAIGWIIGYTWRHDMLPSSLVSYRVPGWLLGIREKDRAEDFEGLSRRLVGENLNPILATSVSRQEEGRQRTLGRQLID